MNQPPERCPLCNKSYGHGSLRSEHHNWRLFAYHIDEHTKFPAGYWRCYCGWNSKPGITSSTSLVRHLQEEGIEHLILAAVAKIGGDARE